MSSALRPGIDERTGAGGHDAKMGKPSPKQQERPLTRGLRSAVRNDASAFSYSILVTITFAALTTPGLDGDEPPGRQPTRAAWPPSTASRMPVMNAASSEARNSAALATSHAVPWRPSGTIDARASA